MVVSGDYTGNVQDLHQNLLHHLQPLLSLTNSIAEDAGVEAMHQWQTKQFALGLNSEKGD